MKMCAEDVRHWLNKDERSNSNVGVVKWINASLVELYSNFLVYLKKLCDLCLHIK